MSSQPHSDGNSPGRSFVTRPRARRSGLPRARAYSGSAGAADRNALVAGLAGQLAPERIKRLDALGVLKTGRETAQSKKALRELRDSGASGADPATVGRLAARLPDQ